MPLSDKNFWARVWLCFFAYAAFASLFIQFVLLPYIVPQWHAGHGLMTGHDWVTYHAWGVEFSRFLRMGDWHSWLNAEAVWVEVRAISIPYALIAPEPWALIPFNAAIHASTGVILSFVFLEFVPEKRFAAMLGSLPYIFLPSALLWTSQIHKDGANNLALAAYLFGWVLLFRTYQNLNLRRLAGILLLIGFGSYFSWVLRPYLGLVLSVCSCLFLILGIAHYLYQVIKKSTSVQPFGKALVCVVVLVFALIPTLKRSTYSDVELSNFHSQTLPENVVAENTRFETDVEKTVEKADLAENATAEITSEANSSLEPPVDAAVATSEQTGSSAALTAIAPATPQETTPHEPKVVQLKPKKKLQKKTQVFMDAGRYKVWQKTPYIPDIIENRAYSIASVRTGFIGSNLHRPNIDNDVFFYQVSDVLKYIPRGLQLAALAPFPSSWVSSSNTEYNSFFKKIVILEMLIVYAFLPFFIALLLKNYKKRETWILFLFSFSVLVLFGLTVANLGTLCRFRYFFLMTWVGMGASYAYAHKTALQNIKFPKLNLLKTKTA